MAADLPGCYNSNNLGDFDNQEPYSIDTLLEIARQIGSLDDAQLRASKKHLFYKYALAPYYGAVCSDMPKEAGDVLYHLSGMVPEDERHKILIHPRYESRLIADHEGAIYGFTDWHSLEDWRKEWKHKNMFILDLSLLLDKEEENYLKDL